MLRTMFYMGTIITVRLIMGIGMVVVATIGTYGTVFTPSPACVLDASIDYNWE